MNEVMFVVWECNKRESSKPLKPEIGCGEPNVMRSTLTNGNRSERWMGKCSKNKGGCGCKKSLNPGEVHFFETRQEAEEYADMLRRYRDD